MNKPTPDFAIFQNSRTKESALWLKGNGEWKRCSPSDYKPIFVMANMIRSSPDPSKTLNEIAGAIVGLGGYEQPPDEDDRIE